MERADWLQGIPGESGIRDSLLSLAVWVELHLWPMVARLGHVESAVWRIHACNEGGCNEGGFGTLALAPILSTVELGPTGTPRCVSSN